jgi:hypothetical protein
MARGPAYPYISLLTAVDLTRKLYEFAKRGPANVEAVLKDKWGLSSTSSGAGKTVAALRYFGLVDMLSGPGEAESIKITDRAYRILVDDPTSPARKKALKEACLSPKAYKLCWDLWGAEMPPSMRSTLIFDHGFIESTVDIFLVNYKKSAIFAGLLGDEADVKQGSEEPLEGGKEAADSLESTATAHPMQPSRGWLQPPPQARALALEKGPGMRQEVFTLAEGDVVIQWPERISADSLEDFKDWLALLQRKISRGVVQSTSLPATSPDDGDTA